MAENIIQAQQKQITVDKVQVNQFQVMTVPGAERGIAIAFDLGYDDAEGNFIKVESKQLGVTGQDFIDVVTAMPDPEKNIYENIKGLLYAKIAESLAQ